MIGRRKKRTWSTRPRKQGASTRQSRSCLPLVMVCSQNTMSFIRTCVSSGNCASLSPRRMLNIQCVVRLSACHESCLLYRAQDEQETPASTRTFVRPWKPLSRVCACAGVLHWHPRWQTSEINLKAAKADFAKSGQKLLDEIDTLDEGDCNS